jgi:hypothetical protein
VRDQLFVGVPWCMHPYRSRYHAQTEQVKPNAPPALREATSVNFNAIK